VVLLGAVIAAYAPVLLGRAVRPWTGPGVEFRQALALLEELDRTRRTSARGRDLDSLAEALAVDALALESLMDDLAALGWVSRLDEPAPQRWVLLVDLHETPAAALVDALLLKPDPALASFRSHTGMEKWRLAELMPSLNDSRPVSTPASP
jgi:membrane protein